MTLVRSDPSTAHSAPSVAATKSALSKPRLGGFAWEEGGILVCKTGVHLRLGFPLFWEMAHWAFYLPVLALVALFARLHRRGSSFRIWYTPDRAGPWYLLRGAALWAGLGVARTVQEADAAFYFDDSTEGSTTAPDSLRLFNGDCTDISKSHVATVFAEVFGYPLQMDPRRGAGPIVEKAEKNGVHDGRLVNAPVLPRHGYVYQRLIDTTDADGLVHDLRTPCVGGAPVVVWEKSKPSEKRFAIHNSRAVLRDPSAVYSSAELDLIAAFTARMGLDWGGLDILRDRNDGRIYIVDVNKTDLGPVIALSWADKIRSMHRLAGALSRLVKPDEEAAFAARDTMAAPAHFDASDASRSWAKSIAAPLLPIGLVLILGIVWAILRPQNAAISGLEQHANALRDLARAHPMLALMAFVPAYALAVSLMLPVGLIMIFAGGYLLGPVGGAVGSMAGATLGATISYGIARLSSSRAAGGWERRLPALSKLRAAVVRHPFRLTLFMRLMPLTPFTLVSLAAGLNRIGLGPFALGTLVGVAPECIVYSSVGAGLSNSFAIQGATAHQPWLWIALAATATLIGASLIGRHSNTNAGDSKQTVMQTEK